MVMQMLTISRRGADRPIYPRVHHARTLWQRLRGLLGRPALIRGEGLLITPCNSVHTFGMRYPLDLVFLDHGGTVVKCVTGLRPYCIAAARRARHTLELAPGSIASAHILVGDVLQWASAPTTLKVLGTGNKNDAQTHVKK